MIRFQLKEERMGVSTNFVSTFRVTEQWSLNSICVNRQSEFQKNLPWDAFALLLSVFVKNAKFQMLHPQRPQQLLRPKQQRWSTHPWPPLQTFWQGLQFQESVISEVKQIKKKSSKMEQVLQGTYLQRDSHHWLSTLEQAALPLELWSSLIFPQLPTQQDRLNCAHTCKTWRAFALQSVESLVVPNVDKKVKRRLPEEHTTEIDFMWHQSVSFRGCAHYEGRGCLKSCGFAGTEERFGLCSKCSVSMHVSSQEELERYLCPSTD